MALSFLVGGLTVLIYAISNLVVTRLSPMELPMTSWESRIPLVPETFWIYSTVYFIYFSSCFLQRDLERLSRFLNAYVIAYLVAAVWFVAFPTTFPREAYPLDAHVGWSARALELFRSLDQPTNCLPSMHVASGVMSAAPFYRRRPRVFAFFCVWTVAIAVTTLTTKQHYFVDVVGGVVFGCVAAWLTYRPKTVRVRPGSESFQAPAAPLVEAQDEPLPSTPLASTPAGPGAAVLSSTARAGSGSAPGTGRGPTATSRR